ncbi:MAG: DUF2779 domain-containing protein [Erysipelotrichaceae bacterium]|nr:DUF2779 domain-containing protein [Erysipelotrichaceae bacterium]
MFHISDCKKYTRCPHLFLYEQEDEKHVYQSYVRIDEPVSELAMKKLGVTNHFLGKQSDDPSLAMRALYEYDWLVKARFEYKNLRIKVPFLHRNGDGWDLYFMYIGLYPHVDDIQYYCDMVWVLEGLHIKIKQIYMIHLNKEYQREEQLDPNQLFTISTCFYNDKDNPSGDLKQTVYDNMHDITFLLEEMENCNHVIAGKPVRKPVCNGRVKCRYYQRCFKEEDQIEDNSILTLIASQHKRKMYQAGRKYLKDADENLIEGLPQQYAQIQADYNGGLFVDQNSLKNWLSCLQYPITCIDFEWDRFAIPPYKGMHPYDVVPFEYSLHIMHADGHIDHQVYINVHDDREDIAQSLITSIPKNGSVLAYNAEGAEKIRIQELADLFPAYAKDLLQINARMEDLQLPFSQGVVYDVRMRGQWSLKTIMAMMDDEGYNSLSIQQGMDAVFAWRNLDKNMDDVDIEKSIADLKAYCGMDTYAMTVVLKWLFTLVE